MKKVLKRIGIGLFTTILIVVVLAFAIPVKATVEELHELTNAERQKAGLPTLRLNESLNKSANDKCNDMVNRKYFDHKSPDGQEPWAFIKKYINYSKAGENLAEGYYQADETVSAWMKSPTHRDNILNASYSDVGFSNCGKYTVQHFIAK